MRKTKLTAKEQAFCLQQKIMPDYFKDKKSRDQLTDEEICLIKNIYASFHEVVKAYTDVKFFHDGFYKSFVEKHSAEPYPIKYTPNSVDYSANLIDILKEMAHLIAYYEGIRKDMRNHMQELEHDAMLDWVLKIVSQEPKEANILLLQVKGFKPTENLNTKTFADGIKDLKANPSKNICSMSILEKDVIKLAFAPSFHSKEDIGKIIKGFFGTPDKTDVTWI